MSDLDSPFLKHAVDAARRMQASPFPMPDLEALADEAKHRSARRRTVTLVAGLALAASLSIGTWAALRPQPVSFEVEGLARVEAGLVRTAAEQSARLRFSEGSVIELAEVTRLRVIDPTVEGVHVQLAEGRAEVAVVHRDRTRWTVDSGPFTVHVTGTRFAVAWNLTRAEATVELLEGQVTIEGPGIAPALVLKPGQRFTGVVRPEGTHVEVNVSPATQPTEAPPPAPVEGVGPPRTAASPSTPTRAPVRAPRTPSRPLAGGEPAPPNTSSDWAAWSAAGEFERIIEDAQSAGIQTALRNRSVDDLLLLGDAARYLSNRRLAEDVFEAAHRRAGRMTQEAAVTSFRLGQLLEQTSPQTADTWYRRSLEEAPTGPLAAEALGRRLLMARRAGSADAASLARAYLSQFPTGAAAAIAREMLAQ